MHDLRFYTRTGEFTAGLLADTFSGQVIGNPNVALITVAASDNAEAGAVCFFENNKPENAADVSPDASACFVREDAAAFLPKGVTAIVVDRPRLAFSRAAISMLRQRDFMDDHEDLGPAQIAATARISPTASIGAGVEIGEHSVIAPNVTIGPGVRIGTHTRIGPGSVIECALIGNRVTIKSNTVIGGTGFGVVPTETGTMHAPHFGRVIIQDDVSIGSCCCIDRGVFSDTVIGEFSRLDNLVQVAHNCTIGRGCIIAGFCGISGSSTLGDWVQFGGRVGTADHVSIGEKARLAAYSGIMRDVPPGETWGGTPAKPLRAALREMAWLAKNASPRNTKS